MRAVDFQRANSSQQISSTYIKGKGSSHTESAFLFFRCHPFGLHSGGKKQMVFRMNTVFLT